MGLTLYHNPRCSKSRKTLEILESANADVNVVRYLDEPPTAVDIQGFARMAGLPVADFLRQGESVVREASDLPSADDEAALAAWIAAHPAALQRPIVVDRDAGRAVIGRPPENVTALI